MIAALVPSPGIDGAAARWRHALSRLSEWLDRRLRRALEQRRADPDLDLVPATIDTTSHVG
jgi:hypothetical protein